MYLIGRTLKLMIKQKSNKNPLVIKQFQRCINVTCSKYVKEKEDPETEKRRQQGFDEEQQKHLMVAGSFEQIKDKNRQTYLDMIHVFENKDKQRRNHVEFIYAAMKNMENFGVNKDLDVYKALINVMPKGRFIPQNAMQVEFQHYPKQQQCIVDLLEQMEDNGVMPDYEMEDMLVNVFGRKGHPVRKFWRMMYWMPKFRNANPWLLPNPMPNDILEIAKMAIEQMCTVDLNSKISVYKTNEVADCIDDTWIVSGQSPDQKKLLKAHDPTSALHIEGPFLIWLRDKSVNYYILRGEAPPIVEEEYVNEDDVSNLKVNFFGLPSEAPKSDVTIQKTVHEQDDGTVYAICATGTSTKDSLLSWIRLLERDGNESLGKIPVLFKFRTPPTAQLVKV